MKQILFYLLLVFQAVVILLIAMQHYLIDDYGKTIKLLTDRSSSYEYYDDYSDTTYIDYEINNISEEIWEMRV